MGGLQSAMSHTVPVHSALSCVGPDLSDRPAAAYDLKNPVSSRTI